MQDSHKFLYIFEFSCIPPIFLIFFIFFEHWAIFIDSSPKSSNGGVGVGGGSWGGGVAGRGGTELWGGPQ